ncbi:hypothetical protein KC19_VG062000 [Ceratodon purpureus]|uniref:Uncharacterized protein n=1 Tax=Ceratodon purpureus TaxID=3225 RepID=A0A8T0HMG7_CERPU|nr:hypothetical protein KC19_VG062000 [Ceratodon purpureus]
MKGLLRQRFPRIQGRERTTQTYASPHEARREATCISRTGSTYHLLICVLVLVKGKHVQKFSARGSPKNLKWWVPCSSCTLWIKGPSGLLARDGKSRCA